MKTAPFAASKQGWFLFSLAASNQGRFIIKKYGLYVRSSSPTFSWGFLGQQLKIRSPQMKSNCGTLNSDWFCLQKSPKHFRPKALNQISISPHAKVDLQWLFIVMCTANTLRMHF